MKNIFSVLLFAGLLFLAGNSFGQSYLGLDGGFEGAATIVNGSTNSTPVATNWTKSTATATIANETSTVRSGDNSLKVTSTSATLCRIFSPQFTVASSTTKWQVQYYRRSTSNTNTVQNQTGNYRNGTEQSNGSYTGVAVANTWEKVTYSPSTATSATTAAAHILAKQLGSGGSTFYDDFVLYESAAADIVAPNDPTAAATASPTTSSLDVSWTAASGGVDGGGYIVVRYAVSPNANNDPNQNGIYAVGNTTNNGTGSLTGTIVYVGTGVSFTNTGLSAGTQYWYKVYTYDKAYNYSNENSCNGTTLTASTNLYWGGTTGSYSGVWTTGTPWGTTTSSGATTAWPGSGNYTANFNAATSGIATIPTSISVVPYDVILNASTTFNTAAATNGNLTSTINLNSNTLTTAPVNATTLTLSGDISGTGSFIHNGPGIIALSGANPFTGGFTINDGKIIIGVANAMGNTGALNINGGTLATASNKNITARYSGINIGGDFTFGTPTNDANISFADNVSLGNTTRIIDLDGTSGTSVYTFSGLISGTSSAGLILSSIVSSSVGNGTLVLSKANNTYPGSTTIRSGTLQAGIANTLPSTTDVIIGNTFKAVLDLNNFNQTIASLSGNGGNVTLGSATLTVNGSSSTTFLGVISGSGSLVKNGSSTLTLAGANTYTGATTVSGGILQLGATGTSPNTPLGTAGAGTTVSSGGALDLNGFDLATAEGLTLNGTGISNGGALINSSLTPVSYTGNVVLASNSSINTNGNIILYGAVSGSGGLTKIGAGILRLDNVNTYGGTTSVKEGELRLNPSANLSLSGACSFDGGTLSMYGITASPTKTITFNSIILTENSTLQLSPTDDQIIKFTNLGALTAGKLLTINSWVGLAANFPQPGDYFTGVNSGSVGQVFIGTTPFLTAAQLAQIRFYYGGAYFAARQLSTGQIVPTLSLVISNIANQVASVGFSVTVTAKDLSGNNRNMINATGIILTSNGNAGAIGGTTTGTIAAGTNSVTISGVTFPSAGTAVTITATQSSGDQPRPTTSNTFDVTTTNSITTGTISGSPFCSGTTTSVPFTYTPSASFPSGGSCTFTAELSNASGSFASPTSIGTVVSDASGSQSITATIPAVTGTGYRIRVTSNSPVITGADNGSNLTINTTVTPSVSITSSPAAVSGTTTICAGASVTFTATPTNGGGSPMYQWKLNGSNIATGVTYTTSTLTNTQTVTCDMTSNATCPSSATVTSNTITMAVNAVVTPAVSIAITTGANPTCTGNTITFTATPTNGGGAPTYQWKVNGSNIATGVTYTTTTLADADVVTCVMTSNATCPSPATATATGITITNNTPATPTFTASSTSVALGQTGVVYTVTNVSGVTYNWTYITGSGATITGSGNSVTVDFSTIATNGSISVTASKSGCTSTAATVAVTVSASNESNVVDNTTSYSSTTPEFNINPDYINFTDATSTTTGKMIPMKLKIQDGGDDLVDADKLNTILTGIKFTVKDFGGSNQLAQIKTAILTTSGGTVIATASKVGTELVFSGMSGTNVTAVDVDNSGSGDKIIHLRVSFDETAVIDNTKLIFQVSNVTAGSGSSTFAATTGGAAQTDNSNANDRNRIEVTATKLAFVQQPTGATNGATMSPAVTVSGVDANNKQDLDYVGNVTIACSTPSALTAGAGPVATVSGIATFSGIVHGTDGTYTMSASATGITGTGNSNSYIISNVINGSYRTTLSGTTNWSTLSNWETVSGGIWSAASTIPNSTTAIVYINRNFNVTCTGGAKYIVGTLYVNNNSTLTINASTGGCSATPGLDVHVAVVVYSGSAIVANATMSFQNSSATFELEDNASITLNYNVHGTSLVWAGKENFHPNSTVILNQWNPGGTTPQIFTGTNIFSNTYNGYTAAFGNLTFDFKANPGNDVDIIPGGVSANLAHGNLYFLTSPTAGGVARKINIGTTGTITSGIGGDFIVDNTYTGSDIIQLKTSGTLNFTIKGNMQLDAATVRVLAGSTAGSSTTLNIDGDLILTPSSVLDFNSTVAGGSPAPLATINLKGDLTGTGSGLLQNSNTSSLGVFNFTGTGDGLTDATTQTIDIATTGTNENKNINFNVTSGSYVRLINRDFELGNASGVYVQNGGIFDFGFLGVTPFTPLNVAISGSQTGTVFQSLQGSTLKITSVDGISTTGAIGNVRTVASNRSFNQVATFHYIGKANQVTGNGITSGASAKVIICDLIDNATQLRLTNSTTLTKATTVSTFGGNLDIRKGQVIESTAAYFDAASASNGGTLIMAAGTLYQIAKGNTSPASSNADPIPRMDGSLTSAYFLSGGTIEFAGTGSNNAFQTLRGTRTYHNLKFSGANTYVYPTDATYTYKNLSSNAIIDDSLEITNGAVVDCISTTNNANSFTGDGALIMSGNTSRFRILQTNSNNKSQPELNGVNTDYSLTDGTVEFYGSSATQQQQMRGNYTFLVTKPKIAYYNVDINAAAANWSTTTAFQDAGNVDMNSSFDVTGNLNVNAPAVFRMDDQEFVGGSGKVQVNDYAGLLYANAGGINATGSTGNIRTSTTDVFSSSASYGFVGPNDMVTGSGLPATTNGLYVYKSNAAKKVTLDNTVRADSILSMQSGHIIATSPIYLELGVNTTNKGALDYTAGYVVGKMRRWYNSTNSGISSGLFPLGEDILGVFKNRHYYIQYTTTATAGGYLDVNFNPVPMGLSGIPILGIPAVGTCASPFDVTSTEDQGYWIGTPQTSTLSDGNYTLALTGESFITVTDLCQLTLLKRVGAGNWTTPGMHLQPTGSPSIPTVSRSGISGFSNFGFGGGPPNPLPVELTKFVGNCNDGNVQLDWTTASEKNSNVFMVERSSDGIHFATIGNINAAGFSSTIKNYSFIDSTSSTDNYYRLVEIDIDGSYQSFRIIRVSCDGNGVNGTTIFYSPNNGIEVETYSISPKDVTYVVYEVSGKLLHKETKQIAQGYNKFSLELKNKLANGIYIVREIDGNKSTSTKVWIH